MQGWVTAEDREHLGLEAGAEVTLDMARRIVQTWRQRELSYVETINNLQNNDSSLKSQVLNNQPIRIQYCSLIFVQLTNLISVFYFMFVSGDQ